jgi:RNA recognition motif-containing protein
MSSSRRIYVGNLNASITQKSLHDVFSPFGGIKGVDMKSDHHGNRYAFIEFSDGRNAMKAVRERNGFDLRGCNLRVETTRIEKKVKLSLTGFPANTSWQEVKEAIKRESHILFVDPGELDGTFIAEFQNDKDKEKFLSIINSKPLLLPRCGKLAKITVSEKPKDFWFGFPGIAY